MKIQSPFKSLHVIHGYDINSLILNEKIETFLTKRSLFSYVNTNFIPIPISFPYSFDINGQKINEKKFGQMHSFTTDFDHYFFVKELLENMKKLNMKKIIQQLGESELGIILLLRNY